MNEINKSTPLSDKSKQEGIESLYKLAKEMELEIYHQRLMIALRDNKAEAMREFIQECQEAISFLASAVKCGQPWDARCEKVMENVREQE